MRQFDTTDFDYEDGHFTAEASSLNWAPGEAVREFKLRSHKTGVVLRFELTEKIGEDGDVFSFEYQSEVIPKIGRLTASVFND